MSSLLGALDVTAAQAVVITETPLWSLFVVEILLQSRAACIGSPQSLTRSTAEGHSPQPNELAHTLTFRYRSIRSSTISVVCRSRRSSSLP